MEFHGDLKLDGIYYKFDTFDNLIDQLKENNQFEAFLDCIDKITGRQRR